MKKVIRYIFCLMILVAISTQISVENVNASGFHIAISPVTVFLDLESGTEVTREFKVENSGDEATNYKIYATSYSTSDENGIADFNENTIYSELKNWITFYDGENFQKTLSGTLEPNSSLTITYKITVPDNPPATGQYANIFAETTNSAEETGSASIAANARIGLNLIAKTDAVEKKEARIISNSIPNFLLGGKISANFGVENSGNVHVDAFQKLTVENLFGGLVYEYDEELEGGRIILPEKTVYAESSWEDSPSVGIYRVTSMVTIPSLDLVSAESKIVVVIPPVLLAIIVVLIAAIVTLIIILIVRRHKLHKMRKALK